MSTQTPKPSEDQIAISRVYAQALLSLATDQGIAGQVEEELGDLLSAFGAKPELEGFFGSPSIEVEQRGAMLDKLFKGSLSDVLVDTLQVMNRKGRSALVRALALTYQEEHRAARGVVEVHAGTAVAMGEDVKSKLQAAVSAYSGKEAHVVEQVDETLLGGMVLVLGDQKIDTSIARKIQDLGRRLGERTSKEVRAATALSDNE